MISFIILALAAAMSYAILNNYLVDPVSDTLSNIKDRIFLRKKSWLKFF
jgi:hypothetical protein